VEPGQVDQVTGVDRLGQDLIEASTPGQLLILGREEAGDAEDRDSTGRVQLAEAVEQLGAVQVRQAEILHHQVRRITLIEIQGGLTVFGLLHLEAVAPQGQQEDAPAARIVLDDQNPGPPLRSGRGRPVSQRPQVAGHDRRQLQRIDRLGEVTVAPRGQDPLPITLHGVSGHRDDHDVPRRGITLEPSGQLQPIHPGQLDIHQDQPRSQLGQDPERLFGVAGGPHQKILGLQSEPRHLEVGRVVVDDQDRLCGHQITPRGWADYAWAKPRRRCCPGQVH
jgi:hypothetical protein